MQLIEQEISVMLTESKQCRQMLDSVAVGSRMIEVRVERGI